MGEKVKLYTYIQSIIYTTLYFSIKSVISDDNIIRHWIKKIFTHQARHYPISYNQIHTKRNGKRRRPRRTSGKTLLSWPSRRPRRPEKRTWSARRRPGRSCPAWEVRRASIESIWRPKREGGKSKTVHLHSVNNIYHFIFFI